MPKINSLTTRQQINEVLKINENNKDYIHISEVVNMLYVVYKDIEKIKSHLGIKIERRNQSEKC